MKICDSRLPTLICAGVLLLLPIPTSSSAQQVKAQPNAKKQIKDALKAFRSTIRTTPCTRCKGTGQVMYYPSVTTGFHVSTGQGRRETCSVCGGSGREVRYTVNRRAVRELGERYAISRIVTLPARGAVGEYPLQPTLAAQLSLERYLDLLNLVRDHGGVLDQDKQLSVAVAKARELGQQAFRRDQSLFEALAYQIAKSHRDVTGAGICLTAFVEQVVTMDDKRYVRLEKAEHSWLVRVPEGMRWPEGSAVRILGRVVKDVEYPTVLGANRTATLLEPSIDCE